MAHLPFASLDSKEAQKVLEHIQAVRGTPFSEIWQTMLHHPSLTQAVSDLGQILRFKGVLPGPIRETTILYIASHCTAPYEWAAHIEVARKESINEEILSLLKAKSAFSQFPLPYRDALEAADICLKKQSLPCALQKRLIDQYQSKGLIELLLIAGYYQMLASFLNALEISP